MQVSVYAGNAVSGKIVDDAYNSPLIGATATIVDGNGNIVMEQTQSCKEENRGEEIPFLVDFGESVLILKNQPWISLIYGKNYKIFKRRKV